MVLLNGSKQDFLNLPQLVAFIELLKGYTMLGIVFFLAFLMEAR
jgi:hypothetical protein